MGLFGMRGWGRSASQVAADWVARRDRGLTPAEQDAYLQWLAENPRHASLVAQHERTMRRMARLPHWQPALSRAPNADVFARPRRRNRASVAALAAAVVAIATGAVWLDRRITESPGPRARTDSRAVLRENERRILPDGSRVELREGSRVEEAYTTTERRVRLTGGEAHFAVMRDARRPFVVEAGGVAVRALGTEFVVRLEVGAVDVLVTEGKVSVEPAALPSVAPERPTPTAVVAASQRVVVSREEPARPPEVLTVTAEEVREVLAWQAPRFHFDETPLAEAVAEFNRRNAQRLVIGDAELARVPIGGTFRVDNVDGFVSLLGLTLGIRAEAGPGGEIVLRRRAGR